MQPLRYAPAPPSLYVDRIGRGAGLNAAGASVALCRMTPPSPSAVSARSGGEMERHRK